MFSSTSKVEYGALTPRQKENFNYQKLAGLLADYGFVTHRLSDDWQAGDFIAQHIVRADGVMTIELKARLSFEQKFVGRNIHIAFNDRDTWYIYPHDEILDSLMKEPKSARSISWSNTGGYSFPYVSTQARMLLEPYRLS